MSLVFVVLLFLVYFGLAWLVCSPKVTVSKWQLRNQLSNNPISLWLNHSLDYPFIVKVNKIAIIFNNNAEEDGGGDQSIKSINLCVCVCRLVQRQSFSTIAKQDRTLRMFNKAKFNKAQSPNDLTFASHWNQSIWRDNCLNDCYNMNQSNGLIHYSLLITVVAVLLVLVRFFLVISVTLSYL